jgi:hypothetical protein
MQRKEFLYPLVRSEPQQLKHQIAFRRTVKTSCTSDAVIFKPVDFNYRQLLTAAERSLLPRCLRCFKT